MHYLLLSNAKNGSYSGPYSADKLKEMARQGMFTGANFIWYPRDGKWQWVEARSLAEFIPLFRAAERAAVKEARAEASEIRGDVEAGARPPTTIVAFGGGKGGIGKTSLTAGLGLCLAAMGRTVILVDGDLGGANLSTALGMPEAKRTSVDFFIRREAGLEDLLTPTRFENLLMIGGQAGVPGLANPKFSQKLKFLNQLKKLAADFVLLDVGAGTTYDTLDFFLSSDRGVLITCPDPLSLDKTYGFLKAATYRGIARSCAGDAAVRRHLERMAARAFRPTIDQFLVDLGAEAPESCALVRKRLNEHPVGLILNMVMRRAEIEDAHRMIAEASHKIGVPIEYLGPIAFDPSIRLSVRKHTPFVVDRPKSKASRDVMKIAVERFLPKSASGPIPPREAIRRLKRLGAGA